MERWSVLPAIAARSMSLIDRLREALTLPPVLPPLEGDLPEERALASVPAAVLVGITDRPDPGVILTVRREHMRTHGSGRRQRRSRPSRGLGGAWARSGGGRDHRADRSLPHRHRLCRDASAR